MTRLTMSPGPTIPARAFRADPLTQSEIDKHRDGARIWALIAWERAENDADVLALNVEIEEITSALNVAQESCEDATLAAQAAALEYKTALRRIIKRGKR